MPFCNVVSDHFLRAGDGTIGKCASHVDAIQTRRIVRVAEGGPIAATYSVIMYIVNQWKRTPAALSILSSTTSQVWGLNLAEEGSLKLMQQRPSVWA